MANPFVSGQATGGFGQQQRPAFGQASPFGQSAGFGTPPLAYGSGGFGSTPSGFGTSGMNQPSGGFCTSGMNQPSGVFGTSGMNIPFSGFGASGMNQPSSGCGTSINQPSSGFGTSGMNQPSNGFGISGTNPASSGFGTSQTGSGGFRTTTSTSGFGPQAKSSVLNLVSYIEDAGWASALKDEFQKDYFKGLEVLLQEDYKEGVQVFPPKDLIFNAFNKTPLDQVKVVILGQDPYHDDGQAMGLSFSVPDGMRLPPSLKNIYKELVNDQNIKNFNVEPTTGCLEKWAERGVLLINATLTVEAHKPNSHAEYGWQTFTDEVIRIISSKCSGVVFVLWGNFAHKKETLIDSSRHSVIKTAHPSPHPFSKWLGCKCFSNVNAQLKKWNKEEINWTL